MKKLIIFLLIVAVLPMSITAQEIEKKNSVFIGWSYEDKQDDWHFGFTKQIFDVYGFTIKGVAAIDPTKDGSGDGAIAVMYSLSPVVRVGALFAAGFDAQQAFGGESPTVQQLIDAYVSYGTKSIGYVLTADLTTIIKQPIAISVASKKRWAIDSGTEYITGVDYYAFASWQFGE